MKDIISSIKMFDKFGINLLKRTLLICVIMGLLNICLTVLTANKAYSLYELYLFSQNLTIAIPIVIFEAIITALCVDMFVKKNAG